MYQASKCKLNTFDFTVGNLPLYFLLYSIIMSLHSVQGFTSRITDNQLSIRAYTVTKRESTLWADLKHKMSSLLIDTLKEDLDAQIAEQLDTDKELRQVAENYLQEILVNEQLLSTEVFTTTSQPDSGRNNEQRRTLTEEIAEIEAKQRQISTQLGEITNSNRELVIGVSQNLKTATTKITSELEKQIQTTLDNLDQNHITLSSKTIEKDIQAMSSDNSILLNVDSILDIFELPTLCRLCIMQGNYQEALEIATLVKMFAIKHSKFETFRLMQAQIEKELRLMTKGLVKLLNTNLKQSNILKIFQILNRPDIFPTSEGTGAKSREKALKLIYLNSRYKFITSEVESLKPLLKLKKWTYVKRYIEVYREFLFNSLSIYQAIFENSSLTSLKTEDLFMVNMYIKSLLDPLLAVLKEHLRARSEDEEEAEFENKRDGVILQIIYLCRSLAKYGMDFESAVTWELCEKEPALISEADWIRNLAKVKKFRA